jgi:hypothetical protein
LLLYEKLGKCGAAHSGISDWGLDVGGRDVVKTISTHAKCRMFP